MEQGPGEKKIIEQCDRNGWPLPKRIQEAPDLILGLELYYQAFMDLNTCRSIGFSAGPIPWTAVADYAAAHEFDSEQTEDLFFFTHVMDAAFLEYNNKKSTRKG